MNAVSLESDHTRGWISAGFGPGFDRNLPNPKPRIPPTVRHGQIHVRALHESHIRWISLEYSSRGGFRIQAKPGLKPNGAILG